MKTLILYFSPTGNTGIVAKSISNELTKQKLQSQLVDLTKNEHFFNQKNPERFLSESIQQHDVLLIGSPVYAHHFQYHMLDLIDKLPIPDEKFGKFVIPFVTYGGIDSGIALAEAAKHLKKSGRVVLGGAKFSASHKMTRAFMDKEFNEGKPEDEILPVINQIIETIKSIDIDKAIDKSKVLNYQSLKSNLIAKIIINERKFHEKFYPNLVISKEKCVLCKKCISACPVIHWKSDGEKIVKIPENNCIHCFNCVYECKYDAISLTGDLQKAKEFMQNMINKKGNKENPANFFYN